MDIVNYWVSCTVLSLSTNILLNTCKVNKPFYKILLKLTSKKDNKLAPNTTTNKPTITTDNKLAPNTTTNKPTITTENGF
jgi:hypothetical protein